jgi:UDP-glucose 4-epimerase
VSASRTAVTGTGSFLGARLMRRLAEKHGADRVVSVDVAAPPRGLGVRHREIDLAKPGSDQRLLDAFRDEDVGAVFHAAFCTSPRRDAGYAHELESIGTLNLFAAAAAAGVRHVVVRSFTALYGASGQNPAFLTEERPLQPDLSLAWARDKLEAEQHAASFARRYPDLRVTVLRFAPLFGPRVQNFYTAIFDRRVVPVVMGYDPLLQLLHPDDALAAAEAALEKAPRGTINVVPKAPIPLLTAVHLAGKIPAPVPHALAYMIGDLLWTTGLGPAPGAFAHYARFGFVADGERAQRELGTTPRYSSRDSVLAYVAYRKPRLAASRAEARA